MDKLAIQREEKITKVCESLQGAFRMTLQKAIQLGALLEEHKDNTDHGYFVDFIKCLPFSIQTCYSYIKLAKHSDKFQTVGNLQEAYKQIESLEARERREEWERKEKLIKQKIKTGANPEGWDRSCDYEYKKRTDDEAYEKRKQEAFKKREDETEEKKNKWRQEYNDSQDKKNLDEAVNQYKKDQRDLDMYRKGKKDLDLDTLDIIQTMNAYIDHYSTPSERIQAGQNLIKHLKSKINENQVQSVSTG